MEIYTTHMKPKLPDHLSPNPLQYSSPIKHYELMKKLLSGGVL